MNAVPAMVTAENALDRPPAGSAARLLRLSRTVVLRPTEDGLYLEQPLSRLRVRIPDSIVSILLAAASQPLDPDEVGGRVRESERASLADLMRFLEERQVLVPAVSSAAPSAADLWEHHDLLFHTQSRWGLNFQPAGATYRFGKTRPPFDVENGPAERGTPIMLERPSTPPTTRLANALEDRRTTYAASEIGPADLSSLLYYSLRTTERGQDDAGADVEHRPYPSAGALHALRIYVAAARCREIEPGLYRFNSQEHLLHTVCLGADTIAPILESARLGMGEKCSPAVVLIFAARFPAVFWKYQSIAYRLILIEAGAAMQTLYLTAAALRLSAAGLGCGDSLEFARIAGLDWLSETSVCEFSINGVLS